LSLIDEGNKNIIEKPILKGRGSDFAVLVECK